MTIIHYVEEPERFEEHEGSYRTDQPGWYFWIETWADRYGPYQTREECEVAFNKYCEAML